MFAKNHDVVRFAGLTWDLLNRIKEASGLGVDLHIRQSPSAVAEAFQRRDAEIVREVEEKIAERFAIVLLEPARVKGSAAVASEKDGQVVVGVAVAVGVATAVDDGGIVEDGLAVGVVLGFQNG